MIFDFRRVLLKKVFVDLTIFLEKTGNNKALFKDFCRWVISRVFSKKYITECVCCYVYLLRLWFSTCSSHKSFCHRNSLTRMCLHDEVHKYISWQRDIMVMTVIKRSSAYFLWLLIYLTVAWLWGNLRGNCR